MRGTRHGFAFFRPDGGGDDFYIAEENLGGAVHGDRVEVVLFRRHPRDFRMEASVVEVIARGARAYTGDVVRLAKTAFVVPDEPLLGERFPLRAGRLRVASGEKVLFHLEPGRPGKPPRAVVDEIVGDGGDPHLDHLVIATQYRLDLAFPAAVEDEAADALARRDDRDREDLRDLMTITIDPTDAKDFDDAVSLVPEDGGRFRLAVHIADVAHYVAHDAPLDMEARRRGTSTYFPGHVIPMLPEILSADAMSLRPGEDRRALTVHMEVSRSGRVVSSRLGESLIRSDARLSYEQVLAVLRREKTLGTSTDGLLGAMHELSRAVRRRRFRRGGFDLHVPEAEMALGEDGVPHDLWRTAPDPSHQIIEEFMILANRAACAYAVRHELPFVYRVHQEPDPSALEAFLDRAVDLKPSLRWGDIEDLPKLRRWLGSLGPEDPLTRVIHYLFLRSLKKAVYSPIDIGHFGLGLSGYGHFTSPIRRYPDLWNHRLIKWRLRNPRRPVPHTWEDLARSLALSSTETEQRSEQAEREMKRIKTLRWAERHLGEVHSGRVMGCTAQGLFAELDAYPVEGFVPRDEIPHPSRFRDGRLSVRAGRRSTEVRVGDPVTVQLMRVNLRQRWLDLALIEGPRGIGRPRPVGRRRKGGRKGGKGRRR